MIAEAKVRAPAECNVPVGGPINSKLIRIVKLQWIPIGRAGCLRGVDGSMRLGLFPPMARCALGIRLEGL